MFIADLRLNPQLVHLGSTNVTVSFLGKLNPNNNPAQLTLTLNLDPSNDNIVFVDANNSETRELTWEQHMDGTKKSYQKTIIVKVKATSGSQSGASITLKAVDNSGDFDNSGSHIDYV